MGEIIIWVLVMGVGVAIGVGGIVLLLHLYSD